MFNLHARLHDVIIRRLQYESLMLSKLQIFMLKKSSKGQRNLTNFTACYSFPLDGIFYYFSLHCYHLLCWHFLTGWSILLFTAQAWSNSCSSESHFKSTLCLVFKIFIYKNILGEKSVWIYFGRRFFSFFLKVPHCQYRDSNTATKSQFTFTYQESLVKVCLFCSL